MRLTTRVTLLPAVLAACAIGAGCFSYHKTVDTSPAPVVETVPEPVVAVPATSSSTTTTTTDSSNGVVERQRTSTYTAPY
jgi:hypothetical protein